MKHKILVMSRKRWNTWHLYQYWRWFKTRNIEYEESYHWPKKKKKKQASFAASKSENITHFSWLWHANIHSTHLVLIEIKNPKQQLEQSSGSISWVPSDLHKDGEIQAD